MAQMVNSTVLHVMMELLEITQVIIKIQIMVIALMKYLVLLQEMEMKDLTKIYINA